MIIEGVYHVIRYRMKGAFSKFPFPFNSTAKYLTAMEWEERASKLFCLALLPLSSSTLLFSILLAVEGHLVASYGICLTSECYFDYRHQTSEGMRTQMRLETGRWLCAENKYKKYVIKSCSFPHWLDRTWWGNRIGSSKTYTHSLLQQAGCQH